MSLPFTAYSTPSTSPANRFVSVGPRDPSFVNIPQQTQVGRSQLFCMWCRLFYPSGASEFIFPRDCLHLPAAPIWSPFLPTPPLSPALHPPVSVLTESLDKSHLPVCASEEGAEEESISTDLLELHSMCFLLQEFRSLHLHVRAALKGPPQVLRVPVTFRVHTGHGGPATLIFPSMS